MRGITPFCLLPIAVHAVNVILSNDDGWAEKNIRVFYDTLTSAGNSVVLSAPAENQSGTGSLTATPEPLLLEECEFDSCPIGSPAYGYNSSDKHLNYVNSFPATAMTYGIDTLAETYFGGLPGIALAGPNVGSNLGVATLLSGTVGAATEAVKSGVPGIAFSGTTGSQTAWTAATEPYETVYADLALNVTTTLVDTGSPYLPSGIWLNVNFPAVGSTSCSTTSDFKFVLSRIYAAIPLVTTADVSTCGSTRLPTETTVVATDGCYASISVGIASTKLDASAAAQAEVLTKLRSILSCLP